MATVLLALALFGRPGPAGACGEEPVPPSGVFQTDSSLQDTDQVPPGELAIEEWAVVRDPEEDEYVDACSQAGCMPVASVGFRITPPPDTDGETIGYLVESLEPTRHSCHVCQNPLQPDDGWIWITVFYSAGKDIHQEFALSAVDPAGNQGPSVQVDIRDPHGSGCASGSGTGSLLMLSLLGLVMLRRTGNIRRHR